MAASYRSTARPQMLQDRLIHTGLFNQSPITGSGTQSPSVVERVERVKARVAVCYDRSVPRRAFDIDRIPPRPRTVEKTAAKYGVSKSALSEIKAFVAGFVSATEEPRRRSVGRRNLNIASRSSRSRKTGPAKKSSARKK